MKKRIKLIVTIIILIGGIVAVVTWTKSPSEGSVLNMPPKVTKKVSTFSDKTLEGNYISFQYSGKYVASANVPANNDLERYVLSAGTNYDKRIQVSVANLPTGKLESNGDYIYRQKTPTIFSKRQFKSSVGTYDIWVRNDGTEQTAMLARGNKILTVSFLTSPGVEDNLGPEADALLNSLSWKN